MEEEDKAIIVEENRSVCLKVNGMDVDEEGCRRNGISSLASCEHVEP
jgi:hypothetical protein